MRAVLSVLLFVAAVPTIAQAQASSLGVPARGAVVLVVDPGRARISTDRLSRSIARALARDVVRITDERARDAVGTLTIAHERGGRWHVRFESRGRTSTLVETLAPGGALEEALADSSRRVVTDVESMPDPENAVAQRRGRAATDGSLYLVWTDEILDPFADAPPPPRREMAIFSEVIDPFAPAASRRGPFTEVLDPWGH